MPDTLAILDFLEAGRSVPVLDVRSPDEYARGHIPGAGSLPLFDDAERSAIGTAYHLRGRGEALHIGLECAGPRLASLAETLSSRARNGRLLIYCWRGGMRSRSVAWLCGLAGLKAEVLDGGYKSFRRFAIEVYDIHPRNVIVLGGRTGSGKTVLLKELARRGEGVLDLEALARHKGSVFGSLGEEPPPTQQQFENELASAWFKNDPSRPLWIEDESRRLGPRHLPEALWREMRSAPLVFIDAPAEARIARLVAEYGSFSAQALADCVRALDRKIAGAMLNGVLGDIARGDARGVCERLLPYYDKTYDYGVARRKTTEILTVTSHDDPARLAGAVLGAASQAIKAAA